jgi:hypothetical protein
MLGRFFALRPQRPGQTLLASCATRFGGGEDIPLAQDLPVFSPGRGGVQ